MNIETSEGGIMTYGDWLVQSKIGNPPASWERHAGKAFAHPLRALLPSQDRLQEIAGGFPLTECQVLEMAKMGLQVTNDPVLTRLFQLWYTVLFVEKDASSEAYNEWPVPASMRESDAAQFRALVILSGTAAMEHALLSRRLFDYLSACRNDFTEATRTYNELHGVYGLSNNVMWWLWPVFLGRVFRLGRLTHEIAFFSSPIKVFTNREGRYLVLAGDVEQRYDEVGREAESGPLQPSLEESADCVIGHPFDGKGLVVPTPITLDLSKWSYAVKQGDPIVSLHIPSGEKLETQAVKDSLNAAIALFETHFPELSFRLFLCHSWLLNTELSAFLPPGSNILKFQSLFTIALANATTEALHAFIFDVPPCPLEQLIPETMFQRKVLSFVRDGGVLRDGFGVIPFCKIS